MNRTSLQHIEALLGPQRALALSWLVPLTIVYLLIFLMGIVGNVVTILVILRFRYMQTITNLYLCNLAITDLITLICGKYEIVSIYINHKNLINYQINALNICRLRLGIFLSIVLIIKKFYCPLENSGFSKITVNVIYSAYEIGQLAISQLKNVLKVI